MIAAPSSSLEHRRRTDVIISVVLPVYNESAVLLELHERVAGVLNSCGCRFEIIFVNDGSWDDSDMILDTLAMQVPHVRVVHFSRNFGHQAAVQAGISYARGDAVIIMDSDLQDDPLAISDFMDMWRQGFDVVYAIRYARKESPAKRFLFDAFYRVLNKISQTPMPQHAGNFCLLDRVVVNEITKLPDRDRYFPGLRSWVGFRQLGIPVERGRRYDDNPRVSMRGLFALAKTAIFSFSAFPLTAFYVIAFLSFVACVGTVGFSLYHKLVTGLAIPGWASLTIVSSLFGALNAMGIGILGEYAIRIYDQVRARPSFIVARAVNFNRDAVGTTEEMLLNLLADQWRDLPEDAPQRTELASLRSRESSLADTH
ncbi:glycosyltransferase family 2 protein [Planctomicrobium sp. SH664]|uniref:glycosyltransferase family 2 protein n=1 Tax=Planctomicrobium sp. SH664 TaxID=3448125 RepID=UPI003F5B0DD7